MSDAHTDPLLPRITDEMLAAGGPPAPASALDDRTLAELLAELEDDDQYALDELLAGEQEPPRPRTAPREPVERPTPAPAEPAEEVRTPAPQPATTAPDEHPVANEKPPAPPRQRTAPEVGPLHPEPLLRAKDDLLDEDDSYPVIRQSPLGPVVRSRYGDFRPPVEREPEAQTLTGFGLTRRSRSKVGSILFTVVFVAIFVLILIQAIVSLVSAPGH